jgi:DNA primase
VPDAVADLTTSRTVTAFLDGDRGGELILRELAQVGDVEYVAFAPPGESVEDLDRATVFDALRGKVPYETLADEPNLREAAGGGATPAADAEVIVDAAEVTGPSEAAARDAPTDASSDVDDTDDASGDGDGTDGDSEPTGTDSEPTGTDSEPTDDDAVPDAENTDVVDGDAIAGGDGDAGATGDAAAAVDRTPRSFEEHVQEVVDGDSGRARLLDDDLGVLTEVEATDAFDAVEGAADPPMAVVLDGTVDQRLVDVAAQRGVGTLFGRDAGDLVKRPVGTRIVTVADRAVEA